MFEGDIVSAAAAYDELVGIGPADLADYACFAIILSRLGDKERSRAIRAEFLRAEADQSSDREAQKESYMRIDEAFQVRNLLDEARRAQKYGDIGGAILLYDRGIALLETVKDDPSLGEAAQVLIGNLTLFRSRALERLRGAH